jgi:NAD(P)-dependent dehydrogenase (short-subunit alcohol dehydrogenase family)
MFLESFPIKRLGHPEEIGDLVLFLCSEKASYITGASIDINGGALMI